MDLKRVFRHLFTTMWSVRRAFPASSLRAVERAIRETEATHEGQVRFAVEHALDLPQLLAGRSARARALDVFSQLRVWDTQHNNGVLIYLLLADRDVEIIADRGVHAHVGQGWEPICRRMEQRFGRAEYEAGVVEGVHAVGEHLRRHFPARPAGRNELPDEPAVL
ncbi:MAG TPA: TPM domain-containing protein [Burkholderiales bacterium]|nr:TPM domain-containing protein [Burkholderiales bacterium]